MSQNEVLVRPAAELAREKTLAAIESEKQRRKDRNETNNEQYEVVKDMPTFENEVHNTSPNATNIAGGV